MIAAGGLATSFLFNIEHGRKAAQSLCADAERIDLVVKLQAQFLDAVFRTAREQFVHVDRRHQ